MKITKHEDVGINSIRDLTKEELIECIESTLERDKSAKFWFERRILHIADRRREKKLQDEEAKGDKWISLEKQYNELMKPYVGMKLTEIPIDIVQKGAALAKAAREAQQEYFATFGQ